MFLLRQILSVLHLNACSRPTMYYVINNTAGIICIFTRAMLCISAVCAVVKCLSVCPSVTVRYCIKKGLTSAILFHHLIAPTF